MCAAASPIAPDDSSIRRHESKTELPHSFRRALPYHPTQDPTSSFGSTSTGSNMCDRLLVSEVQVAQNLASMQKLTNLCLGCHLLCAHKHVHPSSDVAPFPKDQS